MANLSIAASSSFTCVSKPSSSSASAFHGIRISHLGPSRMPSASYVRASYSPSSSVVMMAKRDEELKEIRTKSTEQLNEEIVDLKGELFMLRLQRSARNEYKSSEFRRMHKLVAFQWMC